MCSQFSDVIVQKPAFIVIIAAAKLGAELFERLNLSAVLGDLVGRVILENLALFHSGWDCFEPLRVAPLQADWTIWTTVSRDLAS